MEDRKGSYNNYNANIEIQSIVFAFAADIVLRATIGDRTN